MSQPPGPAPLPARPLLITGARRADAGSGDLLIMDGRYADPADAPADA